jgi:hypothetical protein
VRHVGQGNGGEASPIFCTEETRPICYHEPLKIQQTDKTLKVGSEAGSDRTGKLTVCWDLSIGRGSKPVTNAGNLGM